ncbi:hypothetical protein K431DRAFT_30915 [Polychaeton citri CBS 116435]|uniref:Uncharacterized protein n=1 Tax=Polychaeton citri CBS 116435 TaxID=1314669 RepID=A0A9P4QBB4_9PEZI|nr:hypothetical protein K431DRAFT_30915 [Polychaeton citri CBS 116435]
MLTRATPRGQAAVTFVLRTWRGEECVTPAREIFPPPFCLLSLDRCKDSRRLSRCRAVSAMHLAGMGQDPSSATVHVSSACLAGRPLGYTSSSLPNYCIGSVFGHTGGSDTSLLPVMRLVLAMLAMARRERFLHFALHILGASHRVASHRIALT